MKSVRVGLLGAVVDLVDSLLSETGQLSIARFASPAVGSLGAGFFVTFQCFRLLVAVVLLFLFHSGEISARATSASGREVVDESPV